METVQVGLRKTSLLDYPGKVSAVIFFRGCNLRCPWCHNPELLEGKPDQTGNSITLDEALAFLEKRRKVLGAAVLSGGEPSLFKGLEPLIASIKELGLAVKLDTNGTRPEILEGLFRSSRGRPDYVAMDLKISPSRYYTLMADCPAEKRDAPGKALGRSAALLREFWVDHEFRTLILPGAALNGEDIGELAPLAGKSRWVFRPFIPGNCLDGEWNKFPREFIDEEHPIIKKAKSLGGDVTYYR